MNGDGFYFDAIKCVDYAAAFICCHLVVYFDVVIVLHYHTFRRKECLF